MISPGGEGPLPVQCDQNTDGGGWTVIQQRSDGSVDFFKTWHEYKFGFGDIYSEYWLGNENILRLTRLQHASELRVVLEKFDDSKHEVRYASFAITDESDSYRLKLGACLGPGADGMGHNNNKPFMTIDKNASYHTFHGAWWYAGGGNREANLNGRYYLKQEANKKDGINWFPWNGNLRTLRKVKMMIRRRKGRQIKNNKLLVEQCGYNMIEE